MGLVRPKTVCFLPGEVRLTPHDVLDADDPVVAERADLFEAIEVTAERVAERVAQGTLVADVQAAAAPAKTRRARKTAAK